MDRSNLNIEPLKTVLLVTVGFLIVHLFTDWQWPLGISVIVGSLGLVSKFTASIIHLIWGKVTWILSLIVPNFMLFFIYYIILIPLAFISKLFKSENQLKLINNSQSMFKVKRRSFSTEDFEKMW